MPSSGITITLAIDSPMPGQLVPECPAVARQDQAVLWSDDAIEEFQAVAAPAEGAEHDELTAPRGVPWVVAGYRVWLVR